MCKHGAKLLDSKLVRYLVSGVTATVVDYGVYELLVLLVFRSANGAAASASIAGVIGIFVAYFLHSRLTWREREPGRFGVAKFVLWNLAVMVGLRPILVTMLGWMGWLYDWVYSVCGWMGVGFSHDFVTSTGIYILMTMITAVLNFLFYDRVVFGKKDKRK